MVDRLSLKLASPPNKQNDSSILAKQLGVDSTGKKKGGNAFLKEKRQEEQVEAEEEMEIDKEDGKENRKKVIQPTKHISGNEKVGMKRPST